MPTGYTSAIYEGKEKSLRTFMLRLSGAFGAMIEFKDTGFDVDNFPEDVRPISDRHLEEIKELKSELKAIKAWSKEVAQQKANEDYEKKLAYYNNEVEKNNARMRRYDIMLVQVKNWTPPTDQHLGIKEFAIKQLEESIKFDCYNPIVPRRKTGEEYKKSYIESVESSINYREEYYKREANASKEANQWAKELIKSLPKE